VKAVTGGKPPCYLDRNTYPCAPDGAGRKRPTGESAIVPQDNRKNERSPKTRRTKLKKKQMQVFSAGSKEHRAESAREGYRERNSLYRHGTWAEPQWTVTETEGRERATSSPLTLTMDNVSF